MDGWWGGEEGQSTLAHAHPVKLQWAIQPRSGTTITIAQVLIPEKLLPLACWWCYKMLCIQVWGMQTVCLLCAVARCMLVAISNDSCMQSVRCHQSLSDVQHAFDGSMCL